MDEEDYAKAMGFHACKENFLLDMEFLNECGMLMSPSSREFAYYFNGSCSLVNARLIPGT